MALSSTRRLACTGLLAALLLAAAAPTAGADRVGYAAEDTVPPSLKEATHHMEGECVQRRQPDSLHRA